MRKLNRALLIHWHNFEKELIEFEDINFLTGKTAAGKSTIIDALQLVLLGDKSGSFFNKAANERSERTLKGYLYGEMGDNEEAGFRYLRNSRFSSYVVLEFVNTVKKRKFCLGIVFDCFKDRSDPDSRWFVLYKRGLPDNLFVDEVTRSPFNIQDLNTFLTKWTGGGDDEFELLRNNREFKEKSRLLFGRVENKYRLLLKKAVPFKPIQNIKQFITESVCEVNSSVDIKQMQNDIREYRSLEEEAVLLQRKIKALEAISEATVRLLKEKEKHRQQEYIVHRARKQEALDNAKTARDQIFEISQKITVLSENRKALELEKKELSQKLDDLKFDLRNSKEFNAIQRLNSQIEMLKKEIAPLEKGLSEAFSHLRKCASSWSDTLEGLRAFSVETDKNFAILIRDLKLMKKEDFESFNFEKSQVLFEKVREDLGSLYANYSEKKKNLHLECEELEKRIKNLENGIKPFPEEVSKFKDLVEKEILNVSGEKPEIKVLSDVLEMQDEDWRAAAESLLCKEKFYLMVPEAYLDLALKVLEKAKETGQIFGVGVVDVRNLEPWEASKGSLGSLLETKELSAKIYIDKIVGNTMLCVSDDAVLEKAEFRASESELSLQKISKDGLLYSKGAYSRLKSAEPFIGQASTKLLLQKCRGELDEKKIAEAEIDQICSVLLQSRKNEHLEKFQAKEYGKLAKEIPRLESLKAELQRVLKEKSEAQESLFYIQKMKDKISRVEARMDEVSKNSEELLIQETKLKQNAEDLENKDIPQFLSDAKSEENFINENFDPQWIKETGEPRFLKESKSQSERAVSQRFFGAMRQSESTLDNLLKERRKLRVSYMNEFKIPCDTEAEDNNEFDFALKSLRENQLPAYMEKIEKAKKASYGRLKDDFINKIKSNIEDCKSQIRDLNRALSYSVFGTDKYRFEVKASPDYKEFYDMFMDDMLLEIDGANLLSEAFNDKYKDQIAKLFNLLVVSEGQLSAERAQEYEKNIRTYTDYRTYLSFDLAVLDESGTAQHLSKTLLKKSGGETQIPFYIAVLASFSQVCRVENLKDNDTIRLIILDEAFSKMDGERIEASIELLKKFKLQAVFSAPPEKIQDISPLCNRTIVVYRDQKHAFVRNFDIPEAQGRA